MRKGRNFNNLFEWIPTGQKENLLSLNKKMKKDEWKSYGGWICNFPASN